MEAKARRVKAPWPPWPQASFKMFLMAKGHGKAKERNKEAAGSSIP